MPRSISGESVTSTVFYLQDEYDALPGTCKTCCLRCAFPTLMNFILLVSGVVVFGIFSILSGVGILDMVEPDESDIVEVEVPQDLYDSLQLWHRIVKWVVGSEIALMVIVAIVMLALGYLATGSVRKEFMCRFKSKTSGRCQLAVFMLIVYFLWFVWLLQSVFFTVPVLPSGTLAPPVPSALIYSFSNRVCVLLRTQGSHCTREQRLKRLMRKVAPHRQMGRGI
ncbi:uncharacterized protein LOC117105944 [Anneissia japonica]|uniref:uncharacterized protein LOC117105944 n=1 Tax=Anneissia japonica TaxID=1529436 RepID=UPI001425ACED|nr:uncharacterized protein LOC117105944 [Anneissia japonica]